MEKFKGAACTEKPSIDSESESPSPKTGRARCTTRRRSKVPEDDSQQPTGTSENGPSAPVQHQGTPKIRKWAADRPAKKARISRQQHATASKNLQNPRQSTE